MSSLRGAEHGQFAMKTILEKDIEIEHLKELLRDRAGDLEHPYNENQKLEREVEQLEDEIHSLQDTIEDLKGDIKELENEKDDLRDTIDDLEMELREARSFICRGEC